LARKRIDVPWSPHALSRRQKSKTVAYSKLLLIALMEQKASGFSRIMTGDESWFFLYYPYYSVWAARRDELHQHIKRKINPEKCLASILWSVNAIHSLLDIPKGIMYNTAFVTDTGMPSLIHNVRSQARRKTSKSELVHMDNARHHNSGGAQRYTEVSRAERLPHSAYSSDLAPSDFFLFGYIKEKTSDDNCESREDLSNAIIEILTEVDQELSLSVLESWVNRLKWLIKHEGKYDTKHGKNKRSSFKTWANAPSTGQLRRPSLLQMPGVFNVFADFPSEASISSRAHLYFPGPQDILGNAE
jgi:hypothetical protein